MIGAKVQDAFIGRHFTADGDWSCWLKEFCYSEHYVEGTSQHVESHCSFKEVRYSEHSFQNMDHEDWTNMTIEHSYF